MKHNKILTKALSGVLLLGVALSIGAMAIPAKAAEKPADIQQAASILSGRGVYQGDASGNLNLDKGLTRAELAAILTRMNDEVSDPSVFKAFCYFQDVPDWARPYVGYTVSWLLMRGYDSAHFGPNDAVNPQMACTVVLRSCGYDNREGKDWTYATASQYAASLGWIDPSTAKASTITRGEMAVLLSRDSGWLEPSAQEQSPATVPATSTDAFEITKDGQYIVHADHWSREDFSQTVNPSVFTGIYDRALYNMVRQAIIDTGTENSSGGRYAYTRVGVNDYGTVKRLVGWMDGVLCYRHYVPENFTNYYEYPDYYAVTAEMPENYQAPLEFIQPVIAEAGQLGTDREKVEYLNDYLCSLMAYDRDSSAAVSEIFASHSGEVKGACGSYSIAFRFLCSAAGIPCINISSMDHTWNLVYVDSQWLHVDTAANDNAGRNFILLTETVSSIDRYPEATAFLKELLIPGSTR